MIGLNRVIERLSLDGSEKGCENEKEVAGGNVCSDSVEDEMMAKGIQAKMNNEYQLRKKPVALGTLQRSIGCAL